MSASLRRIRDLAVLPAEYPSTQVSVPVDPAVGDTMRIPLQALLDRLATTGFLTSTQLATALAAYTRTADLDATYATDTALAAAIGTRAAATDLATLATQVASNTSAIGGIAAKAPLDSPSFTGNPTGPTPTAGDSDNSLATTYFVTDAVTTAKATLTAALSALMAFGGEKLSLASGNLVLKPFTGNRLLIGGVPRTLPSGGVTLAPTGLTAGTRYLVYAYWTGSAVALEASTTGYAVDSATGTPLKSGDTSRTLVGQALVASGPAFSTGALQVRSWNNDAGNVATYSTAADVSGGGGNFWQATSMAVSFLAWPGETAIALFNSTAVGSPASAHNYYTAFGLDGAVVQSTGGMCVTAINTGYSTVAFSGVFSALAEGAHTVTIYSQNPSNDGTVLYYKYIASAPTLTLILNGRR